MIDYNEAEELLVAVFTVEFIFQFFHLRAFCRYFCISNYAMFKLYLFVF